MSARLSRRRRSGGRFASRDHNTGLSTDANTADGAVAQRRAERIRIAIQQRGVKKLTALAAEIGVTEGALTRWRQGGPMSLDNGIRFCQVLDVSLDWLAMGRAHPDHHRQQTYDQDRQRLLTALDALPPGTEAHLARLFEHLSSGGDSFDPRQCADPPS